MNHNPGCRHHQLTDTCHNSDVGGAPIGILTPSPDQRYPNPAYAPRQDAFGEHKHVLQPRNDQQLAMMQQQIDALARQLQQAQAALNAAQQAQPACPVCSPQAPCPSCPPPPACPDCPPVQSCPACPACGVPVYVVGAGPTPDTRNESGSFASTDAPQGQGEPRPAPNQGDAVNVGPAGDNSDYTTASAMPFGQGSSGSDSRGVSIAVPGDYSANAPAPAQDYKPVSGMIAAAAPAQGQSGTALLTAAPIVPVQRVDQDRVAQVSNPSISIQGSCSSCAAPIVVRAPSSAKTGCMVGYSCPSCGKASVVKVGALGDSTSPKKNKYHGDMRVERIVRQYRGKQITLGQLQSFLKQQFGMSVADVALAIASTSPSTMPGRR
jgi:hypothetical protein